MMIRVPSELNDRHVNLYENASSVRTSRPDAASQILAIPSLPPVAIRLPSGLIATQFTTLSECPLKVNISWPVSVFQSLADPSPFPVAIHLPSVLKVTHVTPIECLLRV